MVGALACNFNSPSNNGPDGPPPPTIGFVDGASLQDEKSGTVLIPVRLSAEALIPVSIRYSVVGGDAVAGEDYNPTEGVLTFSPGELEKSIELAILPDGQAEQDETIELGLDQPTGGTTRLGLASHTVTISANILPRVNFALVTSSEDEDAGPTSITITLDAPPAVPVTVAYEIGGTATAADHQLVQGMVTFPVDTQAQQITLAATDDTLDEEDETVVISLGNPTSAIIGSQGMRTHTILDDDDPPTVSFTTTTVTVNEGNTPVTLTVKLSTASGKTITVPFAADPSSDATAPADYAYEATAPLTFLPGVEMQTIQINLAQDLIDENEESIVTTLGTPTNATLATSNITHDLEINDNDDPPSVRFDPAENDGSALEGDSGTTNHDYRIVLTAPSGKPISVPITIGGTANNPNDYSVRGSGIPVSFAPGETVQTIRLVVVGDTEAPPTESDETIEMTIPDNGITNATRGTPSMRTHTIQDDN